MVLASLGQDVSEVPLRQLCECDDEGTLSWKAIDCAKHYGLVNSFEAYLHLEELSAELGRGKYPVVYLRLFNPTSQHAVVVIEVESDWVRVLDPRPLMGGERRMKKDDFQRAWNAMNGLTLVIE